MEDFKLVIIGRSNSGKSTLVSALIEDKVLAQSIYEGNYKGKTKLNTEYCIGVDASETSFEIVKNDNLFECYENFNEEESQEEMNQKTLEKLKKVFKNIIPDIKNISPNTEDLLEELNNVVEEFLDQIRKIELKELLKMSEEKPELRGLIKLVIVNTKASKSAEELIERYQCNKIRIIDTKGFGDETTLIEYEFPKVDAIIYMVAEKLIDTDYKIMKTVVADQIKKIPVVICARSQNPLRIVELDEIMEKDNRLDSFSEYCDEFKTEGTPAYNLKTCIYEEKIVDKRDDAHKSIMELCLGDNIFRELPYILVEGKKSGKKVIETENAKASKELYVEIVTDVLEKIIDAKSKEDTYVKDLINKLSDEDVAEQIYSSMFSYFKKYILEAALCPGYKQSEQYGYFYTATISPSKFIDCIHRYIHGPRGGTSGVYAYNYDRLAVASHVCLERGFEDMLHNGVQALEFYQLELIIRKVRRDVCRYGKLAGQKNDYKGFVDYDKVCLGYDNEKKSWSNNFTNYAYAYCNIRKKVDNDLKILTKSNDFKHASSIYWGAIKNIVENSIKDVLGEMPQEAKQFATIQ